MDKPDKDMVSADEKTIVIDDNFVGGKDEPVKKKTVKIWTQLSPLRQISFWLTIGVLAAITLVGIAILIDFTCMNGLFKTIDWQSMFASDPEKALQIYKDIQEANLNRLRTNFTLAISTTLLPIFSTLLGYLFGTSKLSEEE